MKTPLQIVALLLLAQLLPALPLSAQLPDGSANRAAMQRLSFMVGRWRGEAWMDRGGQRERTSMTEVVEPSVDGVVFLVKGRGMVGERVVHEALGVMYFDAQAGNYVLRSWIQNGMTGDFVVTPGDSSVSWTRPAPGGQVRNTARFTNNEWFEIGEYSRDGTNWQRTMEIRLRREN